jgi:hypothetical protein
MTPAMKPTPPRLLEAASRDGRSRQERLTALIQLGKPGVRKATA